MRLQKKLLRDLDKKEIDLTQSFESTKNTSLHIAINTSNPDIELIKTLCEKGANIGSQNQEDETPISIALKKQNFDIVNILLKHINDNLSAEQLGDVLLQLINLKQNDLAKVLLRSPYTIDMSKCIHRAENTSLHLALMAEKIDLELIELLLGKHALAGKKNSVAKTPLSLLMQNNDFDLIEKIIQIVPDTLDIIEFTDSILQLIKNQRFEVVHSALISLASLVKDNENFAYEAVSLTLGQSLLELICQKQYVLATHLLTLNVPINLNVRTTDLNENKALHLAVLSDNPDCELIKHLCEKGFRANEKNDAGKTALSIALSNPNVAVTILKYAKHDFEEELTFSLKEILKKENPDPELITWLCKRGANAKVALPLAEKQMEHDNVKPIERILEYAGKYLTDEEVHKFVETLRMKKAFTASRKLFSALPNRKAFSMGLALTIHAAIDSHYDPLEILSLWKLYLDPENRISLRSIYERAENNGHPALVKTLATHYPQLLRNGKNKLPLEIKADEQEDNELLTEIKEHADTLTSQQVYTQIRTLADNEQITDFNLLNEISESYDFKKRQSIAVSLACSLIKKAKTESEVIELINRIETEKTSPIHDLLFRRHGHWGTLNFWQYRWHSEKSSAAWASIVKLAKNRILEIRLSQEERPSKLSEISEKFLSQRRYGLFGRKPIHSPSIKIATLKQSDAKLLLKKEESRLDTTLQNQFSISIGSNRT